jgi:hypothetical protein
VLGFLGQFGLLGLPVFRVLKVLSAGANSGPDVIFMTTLSLIIAIGMVDLIPNASLSPWTWLVEGALLGWTDALIAEGKSPINRRISNVQRSTILFPAKPRQS